MIENCMVKSKNKRLK